MRILAKSIIFLYAYPSTEMYAELVFTENIAAAKTALYKIISSNQELCAEMLLSLRLVYLQTMEW